MKDQEEIKKHMQDMRIRSGSVKSDCKLTSFLYTLLRDYVQPGDIEEIMLNHISDDSVEYTNGWLASYAEDIANRLTSRATYARVKVNELEFHLEPEEMKI